MSVNFSSLKEKSSTTQCLALGCSKFTTAARWSWNRHVELKHRDDTPAPDSQQSEEQQVAHATPCAGCNGCASCTHASQLDRKESAPLPEEKLHWKMFLQTRAERPFSPLLPMVQSVFKWRGRRNQHKRLLHKQGESQLRSGRRIFLRRSPRNNREVRATFFQQQEQM